jgi:hypothetical protein
MMYGIPESFDLRSVQRVFAALTERTELRDWRQKSIDAYSFNEEGVAWAGKTYQGFTRWRVRSASEALENLVAAECWPWEVNTPTAPQWVCAACWDAAYLVSRRALFPCAMCSSTGRQGGPPSTQAAVAWAMSGPASLRKMETIVRETEPDLRLTLFALPEEDAALEHLYDLRSPQYDALGAEWASLAVEVYPPVGVARILRATPRRAVDWKRFARESSA